MVTETENGLFVENIVGEGLTDRIFCVFACRSFAGEYTCALIVESKHCAPV